MKEGIGFGSSLYRFTWFGVPCSDCLVLSLGVEVGWFFRCRKDVLFQNSLEEDFFVVDWLM